MFKLTKLLLACLFATLLMSSGAGAVSPPSTYEAARSFAHAAGASPVRMDEDVIFFTGEVNDESVQAFIQTVELWASKQTKPSRLRIKLNSPGGEVINAFGMIDEIGSLRQRGHHITVVVYGMAASAASWILQAADERIIGPNSFVMIHQISSQNAGKTHHLETEMVFLRRLEERGLSMLAKRSKLSRDEIRKKLETGDDWWLDADEALKGGFVDSIATIPEFTPDPLR